MKKLILLPILLLILFSCSPEEETQAPTNTAQTITPEPETVVVQYTLTVTAGEGGTVSTEGGTFDEGTEVNITATPDEGFVFAGWDGNDSDSNSLTINLNSEITIQAVFLQAFTLEINQTEGGTIIGEQGTYGNDADITLEAVSNDGFIFKNWIGLNETSTSLTINLNEDLTISALFIEQSQTAFISKWNIAENKQIKLTLSESYNYDFTIDWGDGNSETYDGNIPEITHEYADSGVFDITIEEGEGGNFPYIKIDDSVSRISIVEISQWGNIGWESFTKSFRDCASLDITASDFPILSNVEQMNEAFWGCNSLVNENQSIANWDLSNVTDISYIFLDTKIDIPLNWDLSNILRITSVFEQTNFNQDISDWDISSAEYINGLFFNNESFNQDISNWNTSNVTSMNRTFLAARSFNQNVSNWDVSNVTDMQFMFGSANNFNQTISNWNVSNVQRFDYMFSNADSFDQNLAIWDISSMESAEGMFQNVTLSSDNYDEILIGWSTLLETESKIPMNIIIDFGNSVYSVCGGGHKARNILINEYGWTITDSGMFEDDIVIDIQGNEYGAVNINGKLWTACNAKMSIYNNGDQIFDNIYESIPENDCDSPWYGSTILNYGILSCGVHYQNAYIETFGHLYTGFNVVDERGIAPDGWRVTTREDYEELIDSFGSEEDAGIALKNSNLTDELCILYSCQNDYAEDRLIRYQQTLTEGKWFFPRTISNSDRELLPTNSSGFSALPGGQKNINNSNLSLDYIGERAVFVTSSSNVGGQNQPIFLHILNFYNGGKPRILTGGETTLGSLRFIKD